MFGGLLSFVIVVAAALGCAGCCAARPAWSLGQTCAARLTNMLAEAARTPNGSLLARQRPASSTALARQRTRRARSPSWCSMRPPRYAFAALAALQGRCSLRSLVKIVEALAKLLGALVKAPSPRCLLCSSVGDGLAARDGRRSLRSRRRCATVFTALAEPRAALRSRAARCAAAEALAAPRTGASSCAAPRRSLRRAQTPPTRRAMRPERRTPPQNELGGKATTS